MSREYDLKLSGEYSISRHRYRELKEFCLQYEEKKADLQQLYTQSSVPPEVAVMGGQSGKPTEQKAMRALKLKNEIELIDSCIEKACGNDIGVIKALRKSVLLGYKYYELGIVPCGRNQFYLYRRKFFFLLDKNKDGYNGALLS